jgi:hypothetical protein
MEVRYAGNVVEEIIRSVKNGQFSVMTLVVYEKGLNLGELS